MMNDTDTPAGRVATFLDARGPDRHNVISTAGQARYRVPKLCVDDLRALLAERQLLLDELAKAVIAAAQFDYRDDDGDQHAYLMPVGPLHRIMPLLEQRGIVVRPGFDGRKHPDLAPNQPAQLDRTNP